MDTPRGRIVLMKEAARRDAAPRGGTSRTWIVAWAAWRASRPARAVCAVSRSHFALPGADCRPGCDGPWGEKATPLIAAQTIPFPKRFRFAIEDGRHAACAGPPLFRPMLDLLPGELPPPLAVAGDNPGPMENRRARVAMLIGCAQQVLEPDIKYGHDRGVGAEWRLRW